MSFRKRSSLEGVETEVRVMRASLRREDLGAGLRRIFFARLSKRPSIMPAPLQTRTIGGIGTPEFLKSKRGRSWAGLRAACAQPCLALIRLVRDGRGLANRR